MGRGPRHAWACPSLPGCRGVPPCKFGGSEKADLSLTPQPWPAGGERRPWDGGWFHPVNYSVANSALWRGGRRGESEPPTVPRGKGAFPGVPQADSGCRAPREMAQLCSTCLLQSVPGVLGEHQTGGTGQNWWTRGAGGGGCLGAFGKDPELAEVKKSPSLPTRSDSPSLGVPPKGGSPSLWGSQGSRAGVVLSQGWSVPPTDPFPKVLR